MVNEDKGVKCVVKVSALGSVHKYFRGVVGKYREIKKSSGSEKGDKKKIC